MAFRAWPAFVTRHIDNLKSARRIDLPVWGITALMLIMQAGLEGGELYYDYKTAFAEEERNLNDSARISDEHISETLRSIDILLESVSDEIKRRGPADQEGIQEYMVARSQAFPEIRAVFATDVDGFIRITTKRELLFLNVSGRKYYTEAMENKVKQNLPHFELNRSKIDNSYILFVSRSIQSSASEWRGVVAASIDVTIFHKLLASILPNGRDNAMFLMTKAGEIISKAPDPYKYLGMSMNVDGSHYRYHIAAGTQTTCRRLRYLTDKIDRLGCMRTTSNGNFIVNASDSAREILKYWYLKILVYVIAFFGLAVSFIVFARIIISKNRLLIDATSAAELANQKLLQLSITDGLTDVHNRRHFDRMLASEWNRGVRARNPLSVVFLDIDLFKKYNDCYGHQAGDECLRTLARVLKNNIRRAGDVVARYGGEEFCLILPVTTAENAHRIAETIRMEIETLAVPHALSPFGHLTASIGIATMIPVDNLTSKEIIGAADRALYRAKEQGRNRVIVESVLSPTPLQASS